MHQLEPVVRALLDVDRRKVQRALAGVSPAESMSSAEVLRSVLHALGARLVEHPGRVRAYAVGTPFVALARDEIWVVHTSRKDRFEARSASLPHVALRGKLGELREQLDPENPDQVHVASVESYLPLEPMKGVNDQQDHPWRRLWAWSGIEHNDLWLIFFFALGLGLFSLAAPVAVQALFTTVSFGVVMQPVIILGVMLLLALTLLAALRVLQTVAVEFISRRFFVRAVWDFGRRLTQAPEHAFGNKVREDLANRLFDVTFVEKAFVTLAFDGIGACLQILAGLTLLAIYHPLLLVLDIFIVLVLAALLFGFGSKATKTALKESTYKHVIALELKHLAAAFHVFRSTAGEQLAERRLADLSDKWQKARSAHFLAYMRQVFGTLVLQVLASTSLLVMGGMLVIERQLSLGQLVAAEMVMAITVDALAKLGKIYPKVYDMLASLEKVGHVVDVSVEGVGHVHLPQQAKNYGVRFEGQNTKLTVPAGQACVVSHPELQRMVRRMMREPQSLAAAQVHIADMDARHVAPSSFHQSVACLHPISVIVGSVRDNLTLGDDRQSETRVHNVLREVGLLDAVDSLPDGLDSRLGRSGEPFEHSQVVRLLVARALLQQPKVMLVDGLFDRLDKALRCVLLELLLQRTESTLLLISSHDDLCGLVAAHSQEQVA